MTTLYLAARSTMEQVRRSHATTIDYNRASYALLLLMLAAQHCYNANLGHGPSSGFYATEAAKGETVTCLEILRNFWTLGKFSEAVYTPLRGSFGSRSQADIATEDQIQLAYAILFYEW